MKRVLVKANRYFDSVFLMRISREIEELPDVAQAVVAMGTPANVENIVAAGFELNRSTTPQDLLVAIDAASEEAFAAARERLKTLLAGSTEASGVGEARPGSLREALDVDPAANLALVSVPGRYAAREARQALRRGLHVMLFSDNVSVEDEIALKADAVERGLLMMGPDCGTAILNGVPLGFANVCRRGSIGIVGASGTGIQEISSLVHRMGGGISQAIGTGGRDLSAKVGGAMVRFGIEALGQDPQTEVIVVVSKAPAADVAGKVVDALRAAGGPSVVHFVGDKPRRRSGEVRFAGTLEEAAVLACDAVGVKRTRSRTTIRLEAPIAEHVLGLFCGGTLCQEAWALMHRAGLDVASNVAFDPSKKVHPEAQVAGHVLWDLGDDVFTVGRPHPMIEPPLRDERVAKAGEDATVGLVLVDCVIGHGAHPNPAGSLADAAARAIASAEADARTLVVLASVTGTDLDPQDATAQRATLEDAGVIVAGSNAEAARIAIGLLRGEAT